jgi:hypothetical protein
MVLPAIPVILAGAAKALGSAAVRKMLKQGVSQAVIRKKGAKEASKKAFKKLRRQQRERASDQRFEGKSAKEMDRMMREEEEKIRSIAEGGMRNPRLFDLKMQAGGKVTAKKVDKIKGKPGTQSGRRDTSNIIKKIKKLEAQLRGKSDRRVTTAYGKQKSSYTPYESGIFDFALKRDSQGKVLGDDYVKIRDRKVPRDSGLTIIEADRFGIDTKYAPKIGKTTTMDKKKTEKGKKAGGKVKKMKAGGLVKKMDGIAIRGKTKGRIV